MKPKKLLALSVVAAMVPALGYGQEAAGAAVETMDKGDVAWMMTATLLVLFMIIPGLALFYGGLVRSKNMLSVLMQCTTIAAMVMVIWVVWGYSFAFGGGTSPFWGGAGQAVPGRGHRRFDGGDIHRWCGHSRIRLHRVPNDLCRDHVGADRRRLC